MRHGSHIPPSRPPAGGDARAGPAPQHGQRQGSPPGSLAAPGAAAPAWAAGRRGHGRALRCRSSSGPEQAEERSPTRSPVRVSSILLLERGDFLPREMDNWDPRPVFVDGKYISQDTWFGRDGQPFQPQVHYFVGGATKMYGAALYRLRPEDFGELKHVDGISPAWPLSYDDFEPWYTRAEQLYQVHGNGGEDPTEGHRSAPYPWPGCVPRGQDPADRRRPRQGRLAAVPRPVRHPAATKPTGRAVPVSAAAGATAIPVWRMRSPTRR